MAVKVLTARQMRDRFVFVLHLDITKMDPLNPTLPDPRWLLRHEWPLKLTGEKTAYLAAIKTELQAEAAERIAKLTDEDVGGTALPVEGTTIG